MNPSNRKRIDEIQRPKCLKEIKKFLGFAEYFRKFIPNFAGISISLYNLIDEGKEFIWKEECDESFKELA